MRSPQPPPGTDNTDANRGGSRKLGRPKMPAGPAERVRDVLRNLLDDKFEGNKAALARALGRSPTAVTDLLDANANPSFDTVCKVAAIAGCTEGDLLFGDRGTPPAVADATDAHPNLSNLLRRLDGLLSPDLVRVLHQYVPVGAPDLSEERWFDTLVSLKVAQSLGTLLPWPSRKGV